MQFLARLNREGSRTLIDFPDAPGCSTFAEPYEHPGAVAKEAIEGWLEAHLTEGDAPPRPVAVGPDVSVGEWQLVRVDPMLAVRLQIRWARQDRALTQSGLAKLVGVSRQAISSLESPEANVTLGTLGKVASALGMDLDIALVPRPRAA